MKKLLKSEVYETRALFTADLVNNCQKKKKNASLKHRLGSKPTLGPKVWLRVRNVLGTPQCLSKDSPLF